METVRVIDLHQLAWFADKFEHDHEGIRPFGLPYSLALMVISQYLGDEWVRKNLAPRSITGRRGKPGYLTLDESSGPSIDLHRSRVIELGENLFNLQGVFGVIEPERPLVSQSDRLKRYAFTTQRLRRDARNLKSTCLELEGMKVLWQSEVPFAVVHDGAGQGLNFEFQAFLQDGSPAFVEVKSLEAAKPSAQAVRDQLKDARRQLPRGGCGVVILVIPQSWAESGTDCIDSIGGAIRESLRNTTRISSVILYLNPFLGDSGMYATFMIVSEIVNPLSHHAARIGAGLLAGRFGKSRLPWLSFTNLTQDWLHQFLQ